MALLAWGSLEYLICAEDKKNGSAKEKDIYLVPRMGAVEASTQVALKQK